MRLQSIRVVESTNVLRKAEDSRPDAFSLLARHFLLPTGIAQASGVASVVRAFPQ